MTTSTRDTLDFYESARERETDSTTTELRSETLFSVLGLHRSSHNISPQRNETPSEGSDAMLSAFGQGSFPPHHGANF